MRRLWIVGLLALLLTGCAARETFETVGNVYNEPESAEVWEIAVELPEEIASPVMESDDSGTLYLCDGYMLVLQTTRSGDLNRTLLDCTGFSRESLNVIETESDSIKRYEAVWTAAGEGGDQVGRIAVLDDGNYHYVLTVMADAEEAGRLAETWQTLFRSLHIVEPGTLVNTGS